MEFKLLQQFKNWLEKTRKEIQNRIKNLYKTPDFGSDVDSGEEESDESEEYGNQLSVAQNYKERLADINKALEKIEKEKYGICERCGKEISLDVLEVVPESELCKECKRAIAD